jgi:hypothetical protein
MSKASDSFVWEHVEYLTPKTWHDILQAVRTDLIKGPDGKPREYNSYMLMGSGHTFPLQTILFYSICKAVLELMGSRAKVDVYGDDIIFPSSLAWYVVGSLHNLGFTVNVDKSFIDGPFRESCGGDYHTGVDVRPFMPEHECTSLGAHEYTEFLHKLANGLLERWHFEEVPESYHLICSQLIAIWGNLCMVPSNEPVTCGLFYVPQALDSLTDKPVSKHGILTYRKLVRKAKKRKPSFLRPYYWYWFWNKRTGIAPDLYSNERDGLLDQNGREARKGAQKICWVVA